VIFRSRGVASPSLSESLSASLSELASEAFSRPFCFRSAAFGEYAAVSAPASCYSSTVTTVAGFGFSKLPELRPNGAGATAGLDYKVVKFG